MRRAVIATVALVLLLVSSRGAAELAPPRLQRIIDLLSDRDYHVRLQAALALGQLRDPRAVPALLRALQDSSALVRGMTAAALGDIGDRRAVAPLQGRLKDRDGLVRRRARAALDHIRSGAGKDRPYLSGRTILVRLGGLADKTDKTRRGRALVPELRRIWAQRINQTPGIRLISGAPSTQKGEKVYEVNASITRLSSQKRGNLLETTCSVSVVLGDHRGSIVMVTSGGATVQVHSRRFDRSQEPALNSSALEGAVASAHSNVVKFLAAR